MKSIEQWLQEYEQSHRNTVNKRLHYICVPLIVLSLLGLLWPVSLGFGTSPLPFDLNLAMIIVLFAMVYYYLVSWPLAAGMLVVCAAMLALLGLLTMLPMPLWLICLPVFITAWVGQLIGHRIEGERPSFFKDTQFLLIGPLWLLSFVYRRLGIRY